MSEELWIKHDERKDPKERARWRRHKKRRTIVEAKTDDQRFCGKHRSMTDLARRAD